MLDLSDRNESFLYSIGVHDKLYLRRQTRPQQIITKQIASPVKPTATTAATTTNKQIA